MTAATDNTTTRQPWLGLDEVCPAWCDSLHDRDEFHGDRVHFSASVDVPLRCKRPAEVSEGNYALRGVSLALRKHIDSKAPVVQLYDEDPGDGDGPRDAYTVRLTLAEAVALGEALIATARLAR